VYKCEYMTKAVFTRWLFFFLLSNAILTVMKVKIIIGLCVTLLGSGTWLFLRKGNDVPQYETVRVMRKDIREEVAATGSVAPAKTFNLQFENSGMIKTITAKVGDAVKSGAALASLDAKDLETKVAQDEAALLQAQAKLAVAREGSRPEDIEIARIALTSAKTALNDAKANLDAVTKKTENDLIDAYEDGRIAFLNNLLTLGNIREDVRAIYLSPPTKFSESDSQAKNSFNTEYLATDAAYTTAREYLEAMTVRPARDVILSGLSNLSAASSQMSKMLDLVNRALAATDSVLATTKTTIATDITNLKTLLTAVTDARSAITTTEAVNAVSLNIANTSHNTALANVEKAERDLALKEAGTRLSEMAQFEAAVAQTRAQLAASRVALQKSQLFAPVDGVVTDVAIEVGEIARAGTNAVSLITQSGYQIDVNVPEVDIPKVTIGSAADITLDAFGPDTHIAATVLTIDPAQTQVEGVVYYKVTVAFQDITNSIRPGMTANVTIFGKEVKNALTIPQRSVETMDSKKIVRVLVGTIPQEREVTLGIRSAKGDVEVLTGLSEGEDVIVFEKKK